MSLPKSLRDWADSNMQNAKYGPGLLRMAADEIERLHLERDASSTWLEFSRMTVSRDEWKASAHRWMEHCLMAQDTSAMAPRHGPDGLLYLLESLRQRWSHNVEFEAILGSCREEIDVAYHRMKRLARLESLPRCKHGAEIDPTGGCVCGKCLRESA